MTMLLLVLFSVLLIAGAWMHGRRRGMARRPSSTAPALAVATPTIAATAQPEDNDFIDGRIALAIKEQFAYEQAHGDRQKLRLADNKHAAHVNHHRWDDDQRLLSVELRARHLLIVKPPDDLRARIKEALK